MGTAPTAAAEVYRQGLSVALANVCLSSRVPYYLLLLFGYCVSSIMDIKRFARYLFCNPFENRRK